MEKESFLSVDLLIVIAVLLSIGLVGYNSFLLPDYEPPMVSYSQKEPVPLAEAEVSSSTSLINMNTADADALQEVPGIGPVMAGRIIDYRERVGVITDFNELLQVEGIGATTLQKLMPYFSLEDS